MAKKEHQPAPRSQSASTVIPLWLLVLAWEAVPSVPKAPAGSAAGGTGASPGRWQWHLGTWLQHDVQAG